MATVTATLTVNPAFLREFKEDNHELRQLLHHTSAMLARPRGMRFEGRRLVELLGKLRDQLALHFSLEEFYGYFEEALTVSPRISNRAAELRSQHAGLFLELCRLADRAEGRLYEHHLNRRAVQSLGTQFAAFQTRLEQHEAGENSLILEAFDEELGDGD